MDTSADERISRALQTLKQELSEMRSLDVTLMRQLLSINDTIQKLTKGNTMSRTQSCKSRSTTKRRRSNSGKDLPNIPIRRQQSTPSFYSFDNMDCFSNVEDALDSAKESLFLAESDEEDMSMNPNLQRFNSMSCIAPLSENLTNDSCYEEILRANILVWKASIAK